MELNTSRLISGMKKLKTHSFCPWNSPVPQAVSSPRCSLPIPREAACKLRCCCEPLAEMLALLRRDAGTGLWVLQGTQAFKALYSCAPSLCDKSLSHMIAGVM